MNVMCRICGQHQETIQHWLAGCCKLAAHEYLISHDQALMVFVVKWACQERIFGKDQLWYQLKWDQGGVFETNTRRLLWDFEYQTVTTVQH